MQPVLHTGNVELDLAFRLAIGTMAMNITNFHDGLLPHAAPVIMAGMEYNTPWTRDAVFNTWFASGLFSAEISKNTLLAVTRCGKDGKLYISGQYWDAIIYIWGAYCHYLYHGDVGLLEIAREAGENYLLQMWQEEFDLEDGLFRGGACFQDGVSGYPDQFVSRSTGAGIMDVVREDGSLVRISSGQGLPAKALSTNALYLLAMEKLVAMRRLLGLRENPLLMESAVKLRQAIRKNFFFPEQHSCTYLVDSGDDVLIRQEGLGHAFSIIAEVFSYEEISEIVAHQHITSQGIPCVWPPFERYREYGGYGRHCGTIWPQVNAAWCYALAKNGFYNEAWFELEQLARKASRDMTFAEIYHPETGLPDGGWQENLDQGIIKWQSCRCQTWCATGFVNMVLVTILGMHFTETGIEFKPFLPENLDSAKLYNFPYRGSVLNITVTRGKELTPPISLPFSTNGVIDLGFIVS